MNEIAIYGAGGFGREVACMINKINSIQGPTWNLIGFFDDGKIKGETVSHFGKILGGYLDLNKWEKPLSVVLCLGNPLTREIVLKKISNKNLNFPNLIDPSFFIADKKTFSIGIGNIIKANCIVTCDVSIGNFNMINGFISLGHDVKLGNFNMLNPGVRVSGEVTIGNYNLFGADSFIKQQLSIGDHVILSPLSALLTNPKDGCTYIGNPARIFKF